jgi:nicotinamidase-related amidase
MNPLADRGIENVILCGVHLNMCVLTAVRDSPDGEERKSPDARHD